MIKLSIFRRKPLVSDDMSGWIEDCFDWFDDYFEPPAQPILPTKAFFTAPKGSDQATAELILDDIKRLLQYEEPIDLLPLDVLPAELRHSYEGLSYVAGTYEETIDGRLIRYDPEQMHRPLQFIDTMVHEVMHARLSGLEHEVPGGIGAHELATDLGCIIAGFGVFQLQGADDVGWSGYMTQPSRAHAFGRFLARRQLDQSVVASYLSPRCQKLLRRAMTEMADL